MSNCAKFILGHFIMAAGVYNLDIEQGTTFQLNLSLDQPAGTDVDITNYTFDGKLAKSYYDEDAVSMSSQIVNASTGEVQLSLTPAQTAALQYGIEYVYDIDFTDDNGVTSRLLQGRATILPGVD